MFEKERKRAEGGKRDTMRAFTASPSDHDSEIGDETDKEPEQDRDRAQELGAAAPAAEDDKKYSEKQKEKREKARSHAKDKEEQRKRGNEEEAQRRSDDEEEQVDIREFSDLSETTPEDFHKVLKQQDREIRELKQERRTQTETNAVFSNVLRSQGAAQKRSEETAVLYSYELAGLSRDDTQEDKRTFVMWRNSEANIPDHEISAVGYTDVRRVYGIQTATIKFGSKGNRTKMSKRMQFSRQGTPSSTTAEVNSGNSTKYHVDTRKQQIRRRGGTS